MSDGKGWTKGPWEVHQRPTEPKEYGYHVTTDYGLTICHVSYQPPTREGETTRVANARLIAAAPDLAEALAEILGLHDVASIERQANVYNYPHYREVFKKARAALARAGGE